ncbi:YHYH protein [Maricaulis sp.]|uniref:YHYH protein n=1 Tax=Maricaulis sp. TaxID=1486257 RepID=UPI003A94D44C
MPYPTRTACALTLASVLLLPGAAAAHPDIAAFDETAFATAPVTVDCTLENGAAASCSRITVNYLPEGLEIGPFCPATLDDVGGIWDWTGENGALYRIDAAFLQMLDSLGYRFFDDDGTVHVVDIATQRPSVDHACINVSADESVTITMLLPVNPVMADQPAMLGVVGKVGVALDGVPIFSDAPSIQQTGHMPALDTCGGHIDPGGWYHWHATSTDIDTVFEGAGVAANCALEQDSSAQFGYAFDGFPMFGSTEADGFPAIDLDDCNGHVGMTVRGETYHYHASEDFPNLPACLVGVQAQDNFSTTATAGIGAARAGEDGRNEPPRPMDGGPGGAPGGGGPGGLPPGFDQAAASLGVTSQALMQALGDPRGGRPDLAAAAARLGITESELRAALPPPPGR